ncbi:MAG: IclR family transcriptional regulator [Planctomycetia bacterium]
MAPRLRAAKTATAGDVPAVDRALDILERLREADRGQTLSELSAALHLPKNAVFRITQTLLARGYLARDPATMRFELTRRLLELGQPRIGRVPLVDAALEPMRTLRDLTRETVQLGVCIDSGGVVVAHAEGLQPLRIAVDVGLQFPFHNNAPGKLLLAWMPIARRQSLIESLDLVASTERTITRRADLVRECDAILACGYATDHAEADPGIHCLAAPILDGQGTCVATVWVSAPSRRLPKASFRELGGMTVATARTITGRLTQGT